MPERVNYLNEPHSSFGARPFLSMKSLFRETSRFISVRVKHEPNGPEQVERIQHILAELSFFLSLSLGSFLFYFFFFRRRVASPQFLAIRLSVVSVASEFSFSPFVSNLGAFLLHRRLPAFVSS